MYGAPSFDHLIGASEQLGWHGEPECFRGLEIDHQFDLAALLDREVSRLSALENFPDVDRCLTMSLGDVATVTHQAAEIREPPTSVNTLDG